ncbi:MAG: type I restriction enzyme HsdR N-terminal domain-containing protein [Flavobacteriales bacterium]
MGTIPQKVQSRIVEGLKRFQPIIESAKIRDVNESDTVVLLTGVLSEILGFDKYVDVTTELAIRGTYCDLALKVDGKISVLIEAKAVGVELREQHIKQAVDYAANKGIEWVVLTNSVSWKVFKVVFSKPIQNILVFELDFLKLRPKSSDDIELLHVLTKEAISKSSLDDYYTQKQATNRFLVGNMIYMDSVLSVLRKELKSVYPDIKVSSDEIKNVLIQEVIKRELLEGDDAEEAKKKIGKVIRRKEKEKEAKASNSPSIEILEGSVDTTTPSSSEG